MKRTNVMLVGGLVLVGLASVLAETSDAAVVATYTSRAAYEGALGSTQTFDFNQPDGPIASLGSQLSISTLGGDASGFIHTNALCGSVGGAVDCFPPVLFTFNQPGSAFGYDNLDFTENEEAVVTISFVNADPSQEFVFDLGGQAPLTPIFFGAISDVDIASVVIYSRDPGTTQIGERANVVDNVTIAAAVPEPITLALLGPAFAGMGFARRCKRA